MRVRVTVQRDGKIAAMAVEQSSGSESLDREAEATLKQAEPLPPMPTGVPGEIIELVFPLSFRLE